MQTSTLCGLTSLVSRSMFLVSSIGPPGLLLSLGVGFSEGRGFLERRGRFAEDR